MFAGGDFARDGCSITNAVDLYVRIGLSLPTETFCNTLEQVHQRQQGSAQALLSLQRKHQPAPRQPRRCYPSNLQPTSRFKHAI